MMTARSEVARYYCHHSRQTGEMQFLQTPVTVCRCATPQIACGNCFSMQCVRCTVRGHTIGLGIQFLPQIEYCGHCTPPAASSGRNREGWGLCYSLVWMSNFFMSSTRHPLCAFCSMFAYPTPTIINIIKRQFLL